MQNGILDEGAMAPFSPPISPAELAEEKQMASFVGTKEFQRLRSHFEERIAFYQSYLPGGKPVAESPANQNDWIIANTIIGEFRLIIDTYLQASEAVKNARRDS